MKHLTTILAAVLCAVCLSGCEDNRTPEQRQEQWQQYLDDRYDGYIKTVNYRGHSYILYSKYRTGGGITHDPDCPCHKEGGEK